MSDLGVYYAIMWRSGSDWGWLRSLNGNEECTTQEPHRRLRYVTRTAAMAALWRFRRDNRHQKGERLRVVRIFVRTMNAAAPRPA